MPNKRFNTTFVSLKKIKYTANPLNTHTTLEQKKTWGKHITYIAFETYIRRVNFVRNMLLDVVGLRRKFIIV